MREDIPNLKGRFFNVALCADCWDRLNPERKMQPEQRQQTAAHIAEKFKDADKDDIANNRCAACDEQPHWGIFVRVNIESLRAMRPK
jgi:hypothetical protein